MPGRIGRQDGREIVDDLISSLFEIQLVRFIGAGGLATFVYYAIFVTLTEFSRVTYHRASVIAFVPSFSLNFALQKLWAFRNASVDDAAFQLALFSLKNLVFFGVNYMLLRALVERGRMRPLYAQVLLTIALTVVSYFVTGWIFKN